MNRSERFAALAEQRFVTVGVTRGARRSTSQSFTTSVQKVWADRSMLALLVKRDIKSRYKDSVLGFVWTLVRPLTQLAIYFIVVGKFLGAERGIPLFAVYIFTGLTAYGLFQEIVTGGTNSILNNAGLVKKVFVPRELFPLATVGTALFNFAIQFGILVLTALVFGSIQFSWSLLYLIPSVIILTSFGLALALLFSAWNVYLRDVGYFVEIFVMIFLWASPILYSWQMVRDVVATTTTPWLLDLYTGNPITLAILGFQEAIWGAAAHGLATPDHLMTRLVIASIVGLIAVVAAQRVFARLQGNFAQEL